MCLIRSLLPFIAPLTLGALLASPVAHAAEILFAEVAYNDRVYEVSFRVRLDASAGDVRRIVTDYSKLTRLSPTIVKSRVSQRDEGVTLKLWLRPCVWVFCRNLRKVSVVYEEAGDIVYAADPAASDFLEASERLSIVDDSENPGTALVTYRARLKPKFVVPPLIGPWLVKRQILEDLQLTSERVESLVGAVGRDSAPGTR